MASCRRLQQVPFHSVSMLERAHRRYCFGRTTRGNALREAERVPFPRRHHQPCRTPPSTSCYSSRPDGFAPTILSSPPPKKGGLILEGEGSIVGRGKKRKFLSNFLPIIDVSRAGTVRVSLWRDRWLAFFFFFLLWHVVRQFWWKRSTGDIYGMIFGNLMGGIGGTRYWIERFPFLEFNFIWNLSITFFFNLPSGDYSLRW